MKKSIFVALLAVAGFFAGTEAVRKPLARRASSMQKGEDVSAHCVEDCQGGMVKRWRDSCMELEKKLSEVKDEGSRMGLEESLKYCKEGGKAEDFESACEKKCSKD